ncbi:hypothetical protein XENOCAPTIV_013090, partial [Xenoophorus captivus]
PEDVDEERRGRVTGRERRNDEGGEGGESQLLLCTVRSCEGVRLLRRGERREGDKRVKNRKGGQVWLAALLSLSHQIRRSFEREMSLCSKTSLLPPQTAAAGIQAH